MGSDSRTATATSSKPRPSWRNRHLSQLSDEQLDDVKQHREATGSPLETGSVGQMAGIESTQTSKQSPPEEKLPRRQAGPDRSEQSRSEPYRSEPRRSENSRRQGRETYQPARRSPERRGRDHDSYRQNRAGQSTRGEDRHDYHRDARPHDRKSERPRGRHDRHEPSRREHPRDARRHGPEVAPARHQQSQREPRDATNRNLPAANRSVSDRTNSDRTKATRSTPVESKKADKQSVFAKLSGFTLAPPVKYSLMAFAIVVLVAVSLMKPIDNSSQSQLDSALTRAMIGFGLARTLNGVISVAQGTEFAVQPAGVGVNFSPGEILDPINDLVERFSWVMLLATSSIGVQKILLEVSSWAGISVLLAGAGLFFLLTRLRNSSVARMADVAGKIFLVMLLVRFLIPVGALANDWVYKQFLQPQYEQSSAELEIASNRIREISTRQTTAEKNDGSLKERAKNLYNSMTSKFDFDGMLDDYKSSAENVSEHAINLIVVFMLQTIVFPLLFLYLIYRLFRSVLLPSGSG